MRNFNKVILMGHVGAAPQQRSSAVATFSIATNNSWKDKATGEWKDRTDWHRVTAFGAQAGAVAKHLTKGTAVLIEGELRTDTYVKDGQTLSSTFVAVNRFEVLDKAAATAETSRA